MSEAGGAALVTLPRIHPRAQGGADAPGKVPLSSLQPQSPWLAFPFWLHKKWTQSFSLPAELYFPSATPEAELLIPPVLQAGVPGPEQPLAAATGAAQNFSHDGYWIFL